jgi:hypothetical protein
MTADTKPNVVTEPGVYDGLPERIYHGDPVPGGSLSSTGARKLLPPSCPARFRYEQDHPAAPTGDMEFGTIAHKTVLGSGPEIVLVDAKDWRTTAARDAAKAAREAGQVPLLLHEFDQVENMAAALREHPVAATLFNPEYGKAEQSLFWQDEDTGVWRRARLDWLPDPATGRLIIADYKTCAAADRESVRKSVARYGYDQQADFYTTAAARFFGPDVAFVFVFQEKTPPYLVCIYQLDSEWMAAGHEKNRRAIEIYHECRETGVWPGYADDVQLIQPPPWSLP